MAATVSPRALVVIIAVIALVIGVGLYLAPPSGETALKCVLGGTSFPTANISGHRYCYETVTLVGAPLSNASCLHYPPGAPYENGSTTVADFLSYTFSLTPHIVCPGPELAGMTPHVSEPNGTIAQGEAQVNYPSLGSPFLSWWSSDLTCGIYDQGLIATVTLYVIP
jgi:hypothetical protein